MIQIAAIDHLALTVADISRTREFYQTVLVMAVVTFGNERAGRSLDPTHGQLV